MAAEQGAGVGKGGRQGWRARRKGVFNAILRSLNLISNLAEVFSTKTTELNGQFAGRSF